MKKTSKNIFLTSFILSTLIPFTKTYASSTVSSDHNMKTVFNGDLEKGACNAGERIGFTIDYKGQTYYGDAIHKACTSGPRSYELSFTIGDRNSGKVCDGKIKARKSGGSSSFEVSFYPSSTKPRPECPMMTRNLGMKFSKSSGTVVSKPTPRPTPPPAPMPNELDNLDANSKMFPGSDNNWHNEIKWLPEETNDYGWEYDKKPISYTPTPTPRFDDGTELPADLEVEVHIPNYFDENMNERQSPVSIDKSNFTIGGWVKGINRIKKRISRIGTTLENTAELKKLAVKMIQKRKWTEQQELRERVENLLGSAPADRLIEKINSNEIISQGKELYDQYGPQTKQVIGDLMNAKFETVRSVKNTKDGKSYEYSFGDKKIIYAGLTGNYAVIYPKSFSDRKYVEANGKLNIDSYLFRNRIDLYSIQGNAGYDFEKDYQDIKGKVTGVIGGALKAKILENPTANSSGYAGTANKRIKLFSTEYKQNFIVPVPYYFGVRGAGEAYYKYDYNAKITLVSADASGGVSLKGEAFGGVGIGYKSFNISALKLSAYINILNYNLAASAGLKMSPSFEPTPKLNLVKFIKVTDRVSSLDGEVFIHYYMPDLNVNRAVSSCKKAIATIAKSAKSFVVNVRNEAVKAGRKVVSGVRRSARRIGRYFSARLPKFGWFQPPTQQMINPLERSLVGDIGKCVGSVATIVSIKSVNKKVFDWQGFKSDRELAGNYDNITIYFRTR